MPAAISSATRTTPTTDALLRRAAGRALAYGLASAVVAISLPTVPLPLPMGALLAKAPPVVARTPSAQLAMETAP